VIWDTMRMSFEVSVSVGVLQTSPPVPRRVAAEERGCVISPKRYRTGYDVLWGGTGVGALRSDSWAKTLSDKFSPCLQYYGSLLKDTCAERRVESPWAENRNRGVRGGGPGCSGKQPRDRQDTALGIVSGTRWDNGFRGSLRETKRRPCP